MNLDSEVTAEPVSVQVVVGFRQNKVMVRVRHPASQYCLHLWPAWNTANTAEKSDSPHSMKMSFSDRLFPMPT